MTFATVDHTDRLIVIGWAALVGCAASAMLVKTFMARSRQRVVEALELQLMLAQRGDKPGR